MVSEGLGGAKSLLVLIERYDGEKERYTFVSFPKRMVVSMSGSFYTTTFSNQSRDLVSPNLQPRGCVMDQIGRPKLNLFYVSTQCG